MCRVMTFAWLFFAVAISSATEFRYEVRRDKTLGGEAGVLTIGESGFAYKSDNEKTVIDLPYLEVRKIDVSDSTKVRIWTHDRAAKRLTQRRKFEFELVEGMTSDHLPEFLAARLDRPVLGDYAGDVEGVEIPAYHRHVWGGCDGIFVLGEGVVEFRSDLPKHSRTWSFEDIETVGSMDPFHFRVTSYAETYNFDLKKRLSEETYRGLWLGIYGMNRPQRSGPQNTRR